MRQATVRHAAIPLLAILSVMVGAVGCGGDPPVAETTAGASTTSVSPSSTAAETAAGAATASAEERLRSRAEELVAHLDSVDSVTPELVAAIESLLVPGEGAAERAAELADRNATPAAHGSAPDEVVEVYVAPDGVSGVTRLRDYYRDQDDRPSEALVDIDWVLVDGEWYRTLENGRMAEGPLG